MPRFRFLVLLSLAALTTAPGIGRAEKPGAPQATPAASSTQSPPAAPPAPAADAQRSPPKTRLLGDLQAGVSWAQGNTSSVAANGQAMFSLRHGQNLVDLRGQVVFARVGLPDPNTGAIRFENATLAWWWRLRYDRFLSARNSIYGMYAMEGNFRVGIDYRIDPMAGYARTFLDGPRHTLRGELGYAYTYERRIPGVSLLDPQFHSLRASIDYVYRISPQMMFIEFVEALWALNRIERVRVISFTSLQTRIWKALSLRVSFLLRYNSDPPDRPPPSPPGVRFQPLDTLLDVGFGVNFH